MMKSTLLVVFCLLTSTLYAKDEDCMMTRQLKWAIHPNPSQVVIKPLAKDEIELLDQYAEHIVGLVRGHGSGIEYNENGLSVVNTAINNLKDKLPESEQNRIAHLAGAFYGKVIISRYSAYSPAWVRSEQQVAVILKKGDRKTLLYPISRAMKQLKDGDDYFIEKQFISIPEMMCDPKQGVLPI